MKTEKNHHYAAIPPRFDDGEFKLGGFVTWKRLIEAGVSGVLGLFLGNTLLPLSWDSSVRILTILGIALSAVISVLVGIRGEDPVDYLKRHWIFLKNRKHYSYRKIRRRVKDNAKMQRWPRIKIFKKVCCTQQFVPVKRIYDHMVAMKDGRYVMIFEFESVDFIAMKEEEQQEIISELMDFHRMVGVELQWKKMFFQEREDPYRGLIKKMMERLPRDSERYKLAQALDQMLLKWQNREILEEPCYLILSFQPDVQGNDDERAVEAFRKLEIERQKVLQWSRRCGHRIITVDEPAVYLYQIYYRFFNRKSSCEERFNERFNKVYQDFCKRDQVDKFEREIKPHHFLAPRGIDMRKSQFFLMDGLYYHFFMLTEFPTHVPFGWLHPFMQLGEGYDVDIFIKRPDQQAFLTALSRQISKKEGDIGAMPESSVSAQEALTVYKWNRQLQQRLINGGSVFYFSVMITVYAKTKKDLEQRKIYLRDMAHGKGFDGEFLMDYEQALQAAVPSGKMPSGMFERYRRNVMDGGAASLYPLTTAVIKHKEGIVLGINRDNHTPVIVDFFNPISNMLIFGATGHGKSYLAMLMSLRLRLFDTRVFVIAPAKGFEYKDLCEAVEGNFIAIGSLEGASINLLELRPIIDQDFPEDTLKEMSHGRDLLTEKIQMLQEFFKTIVPEIDQRTLRRLDPVLETVYAEFGITHRFETIFKEEDPAKGLKKMPVIGDIYRILHQDQYAELQWLLPELERFISGSLQCFNRETDVDLENRYCVIDLSVMQPEIFPIGLFIVESYLWDVLRQDRIQKKVVIFEEMWKLLKHPKSEAVIREIYKTIRGYRGIAIGVTQELGDLFSSDSGKTIFDQSRIKASMYMEKEGARELKALLDLSDRHYHSIIHAEPGEALISTKEENYRVRVIATEAEAELFETDGNKLERRYDHER